jgi:hypothetical protein
MDNLLKENIPLWDKQYFILQRKTIDGYTQ